MSAQLQNRPAVERDDRHAAVRLRSTELGFPADLQQLESNRECRRFLIEINPILSESFTSAQSGVGEQVEERVQPVVRDEVEERACLLRRPDHHLARDLPRLQPARHTGFGPDERLRTHLRRQLDPNGGVEGD
nr:hypothetical protein [Lentzea alba]